MRHELVARSRLKYEDVLWVQEIVKSRDLGRVKLDMVIMTTCDAQVLEVGLRARRAAQTVCQNFHLRLRSCDSHDHIVIPFAAFLARRVLFKACLEYVQSRKWAIMAVIERQLASSKTDPYYLQKLGGSQNIAIVPGVVVVDDIDEHCFSLPPFPAILDGLDPFESVYISDLSRLKVSVRSKGPRPSWDAGGWTGMPNLLKNPQVP